jgi:hypothetical protein
MTSHKITEFYTKFFSICFNITSKFWTKTIFESSGKWNNSSNVTCRYIYMLVHCTELHLSKCNGSWVVTVKQAVNFEFQPPAKFVFLFFPESGLIKSCSSSEDLPTWKVSLYRAEWWKFWIHLRSLIGSHFGMVEGTGLKSWRWGHFNGINVAIEFYKNLPAGSKVDAGTDTQTPWLSH